MNLLVFIWYYLILIFFSIIAILVFPAVFDIRAISCYLRYSIMNRLVDYLIRVDIYFFTDSLESDSLNLKIEKKDV